MIDKIIYGSLFVIFILVLYKVLFSRINNHIKNRSQKSILRKLLQISTTAVLLIGVLLFLGLDMQNVWVTLASILGLIAIGFIAVWSLLSNIVAAIILFITKPFVVDDKVKVGDFEGRVDDITLFFVILKNKKGDLIHIPNSLVFQKEFIHLK